MVPLYIISVSQVVRIVRDTDFMSRYFSEQNFVRDTFLTFWGNDNFGKYPWESVVVSFVHNYAYILEQLITVVLIICTLTM